MSCRRRRGYRRFSTSAYRLLGDFEVAITGGVWVATGEARAGFGFDLGKEGLELFLHHLKECRFPFARRCSSADEFEPNCAIASAR